MPPRRYAPLLSCFVTAAAPAWLSAQTGVAPSVGATEASFEARLLTIPDTASARLMTRTLSARPGELAIVPATEEEDGTNRPDKRASHVFLRVPNITLPAEKRVGVAAVDRGSDPLD